jgi:DEAD/DEAH box helicase domain-containing protein
MTSHSVAATPRDKDRALDEALGRLAPAFPARRPDGEFRPTGELITAVRRLPRAEARHAAFPERIDVRLRTMLAERGIADLYTHQAQAAALALDGHDVVTVTPTASGKTLCYNLPVFQRILDQPGSRALYLFPTKALAQDQLAELQRLTDTLSRQAGLEVGVFTYDGDTPQDARRAIRSRAHVVLSNPDMLHAGILPHHPRWARLFENLQFVVLDELHAYRGVFGSHLANIIRRLHRVCRHYGSDPTFICSSATIANPRELAERLTGRDVAVIEQSGAPRGEKLFVFVNPPVVNARLGIRPSYLAETRRVAAEFLKRQLQVIVFAQSRLSTEILTTYLKENFPAAPGSPEPIRGYRGGYLPLRRREIEKGLREGQVRGVVSTNALELGVDIGALDVSVMAGYPGTIAATWQRAGRAGRRQGRSAAVLVASSAPLDQYIVRNPQYFFDSSPEHALIDPDNLHILLDHIKCAAFELPFRADETFGPAGLQDILALLSEEGFVQLSDEQWHWTHESYPADAVSLRSVSSDNFVVVDTTAAARVIGEVDFGSATATLHEKAIYLVEGDLFQVERLDFDGRKAYVQRVDCDYYTDAITYTKVTILETLGTDRDERRDAAEEGDAAPDAGRGAVHSHGEVHVVSRVVGFKKIKFHTNENVGSGELDLPEQQMHTTSYWLTIPTSLMSMLPDARDDKRDGVVGLAFAMRNVAQLLLMCDGHDIGISVGTGGYDPKDPVQAERVATEIAASPQIFIYDNYPGGIGFSRPLCGMHGELVSRTRELIAGCPCENGCPSCVGPVGDTGPAAKSVASRILDLLARAGHPMVAG